jgi:hypothetical protein
LGKLLNGVLPNPMLAQALTLTIILIAISSIRFYERVEPIIPTSRFIEFNDKLIKRIFENINPKEAVLGTVVASPSRSDPNYYYHWTR